MQDIAFNKINHLKNSWNAAKAVIEKRLQLTSMYLEFHKSAADLEKEIDDFEIDLKNQSNNIDESKLKDFERRWTDLQPKYVKSSENGRKFLEESSKVKSQ